ncbi:MAG: DMT family transporter [Burkholderiales bacterium]|nr:DMT family transporter [Burkholderiales bacterium]
MSQRKDHLDSRAVSLLLACFVFWGFQQVLVKVTIPEIAPVFQAGIRFAGATVLLLLWCRSRGISLWDRDGSLAAGLLAGALFATEFACLFVGLQYSTASRLTVFLYTSPLWVALLLPWIVRTERLNRTQWVGLTLAFAAIVFTLREGFSAPGQPMQWLGDLLGLLAGMFWGLTTVVIRSSKLTRVSPEKLLFYQVAISAVALPAMSLGLGEPWNWHWSTFASGSILLQVSVGAFVSYLVWMWILGNYPATKVSVFAFLTPVFALMFGALWLGEPVTPALLSALTLVAVGIVLVNRSARKP